MTLVETWTYAGLRAQGKSVHWVCPNGEFCSFGATKATKAVAVGSKYEISNVKRAEDGTVESANFGNKKWIANPDRDEDEVRRWTLEDQVARGFTMRKRTVNKLKKENEGDLLNMTINDLQVMSQGMNISERSILASMVLRWLL